MKVSFGFAPADGIERVARQVTPVVDFLRLRTADPSLRLELFDRHVEVAEALARNQLAFGWLPPLTFVRAMDGSPIKLLLQALRADAAAHHSALFVREESPLRALLDLGGRRLAWVSRDSTSGYVLAAQALVQRGIFPTTETFAGSHAAVVAAVGNGTAEAGATFCAIDLEVRPNRIQSAGWTATESGPPGQRFRALATFGAIPGDVICAAPGTSFAQRALMATALSRMHREAEGLAILRGLFGAARFELARPQQYLPLRAASAQVAASEAGRADANWP